MCANWPYFDFLGGHVVVTARCLVVTTSYCSLLGGYQWLLLVNGGYCLLPSGYYLLLPVTWWLLVVIARYWQLLLVTARSHFQYEHFFCISDIQTTNNVIYIVAENFIFNFRIYKICFYLVSFANFSSTEFEFAFALFSHTISNISGNISNVLFSSSLNRLKAFSHYQKFVLITNTQNNGSSGFVQRQR